MPTISGTYTEKLHGWPDSCVHQVLTRTRLRPVLSRVHYRVGVPLLARSSLDRALSRPSPPSVDHLDTQSQ